MSGVAPPTPGTLERWAFDLVTTERLADKLAPPPPPTRLEPSPPPRRLAGPGRPPELVVAPRGAKTPKPGGLARPTARARLLHTFLHHELQAAELFAWAVLAFPEAPAELRRGLARLAVDELRHAGLYRARIEAAGHRVGDFPVRDWFWERLVHCPTPRAFVAAMGLGFEAGNLEHGRTFAARFRAVGDGATAEVLEVVARDEEAHVRFAARWFAHYAGALDFATWVAALPPPLSPLVLRGAPLAREARARAGLPPAFLDELEAWTPTR